MFLEYIRLIWFFLRMTGVNIDNNLLRKLTLFSMFTIWTGLTYLMMLDFIINFNEEKLPTFINNMTSYILAAPALFVLHSDRDTLKELFDFDDFWSVDHINEALRDEQLKLYKFSLRCTKVAVSTAVMALFLMVVKGIFFPNGSLPIPIYNIVDFTVTPYYQIAFFVICVCSSISATTGIGMNISFYFFLTFIYCQMKMLKYSIRHLFSESTGNLMVDEEIYFRKLTEYMKYHVKIIEYYEKVQKVYSIFLFCQATTIAVNCAIQLFIFSRSVTFETLFTMPILIGAYLSSFFLQCIAVTIVTDQMESVAETMYDSDWTNVLSPRLKTGMILIIQKCQRGYDFKTGKIIDINLNTFASILKTGYSFYTLLVTLKSEN